MPAGRPSDIDKVSGQIIEDIRIGCYTEDAAARAGVSKMSLYEWQKVGARAKRSLGTKPDAELTPHERRCIAFSDAVSEARAEWVRNANAQLDRLQAGGIRTETVTERYNGKGELVERTVKADVTLPSKEVLFWRLERTMPQSYGRRVAIEVETPTADHAEKVASELEAYLAGHADAVEPAKNGNGSA